MYETHNNTSKQVQETEQFYVVCCVNTIDGDKGFCYKLHTTVHYHQTARALLQTFPGCLGSLLQTDCGTGTRCLILTYPLV